jgi:hypothetical protein
MTGASLRKTVADSGSVVLQRMMLKIVPAWIATRGAYQPQLHAVAAKIPAPSSVTRAFSTVTTPHPSTVSRGSSVKTMLILMAQRFVPVLFHPDREAPCRRANLHLMPDTGKSHTSAVTAARAARRRQLPDLASWLHGRFNRRADYGKTVVLPAGSATRAQHIEERCRSDT